MQSVAQPTDSVTDQRIRDRFAALSVLWKLSSIDRQRTCQRVSVREDGSIAVVAGGAGPDRSSGFSGLATCGSVWSCPCCAEKILAGRQTEMQEALEAWERLGHGKIGMVTLTMRHDKSQSLESLWDGLSYAWGKVTSGRGWDRAHETYGAPIPRKVTRGERAGEWVMDPRVGYARLVEVTNGENGWHVHIHCALFLNGKTDWKDVDDLGCEMFQRWRDALVRKGFRAPLARQGGLDAQLWDGANKKLSRYFTKQSYLSSSDRAAMELARGDLKKARGGNRSPFEILTDIVEKSLGKRDLALWFEWERVSAGRRQITWSTGLREFLALAPEASDEELAASVDEGTPVAIVEWDGLRDMAEQKLHAEVRIRAREDDRGASLRLFLTEKRINWRKPTAAEKWEHHQRIAAARAKAEEKRERSGPVPWAHLLPAQQMSLF